MDDLTLYDRLGLPRDATQEEIRHAYRQYVLRLHPDRNVNKGETELFIDVQRAYECLANPIKKAEYDQQLPPEGDVAPPVTISTFYSQPSLIRLSEPQLLYALLVLNSQPETYQSKRSIPLNISLVVDCSTSMLGLRLDKVKLSSIDILRKLSPNDIFSLVKFNDWAELLIPPGNKMDPMSVEMKIQLLQAEGGTEIFKGLDMGFNQVSQFLSNQRINHIILITDGRTYGDEASCEKLADTSAALGIGISALGIGNQWNDKFLDHIAVKTGGICKYISESGDIQNSILEEITRLGASSTDQININYQITQDVELSSAFRIQPNPSPLDSISPIILGYLPSIGSMSVLFEFHINNFPPNLSQINLAKCLLSYEIPQQLVKKKFINRLVFERPITTEVSRETPPEIILNSINLFSINKMQERAQREVEKGDINSATRHMEYLATHLLQKGDASLAQAVLNEASYIRRNQKFSEEGEKRIKYNTRALLLPARSEER